MLPHAEPLPTAALLAVAGLLLLLGVLSVRASQRYGIPLALAFLGVGVLAGSEGLGGIEFEDYGFTFRLGTVALVLILFEGGLNTPTVSFRRVFAPAAALATLGVLGTAILVGVAARALGFPWWESLLLGAAVSSTDASALYSMLQGSGLRLKRRVGLLLEMESGFNDPIAVLLTVELTRILLQGWHPGWALLLNLVRQIVFGAAFGWGLGRMGRLLLGRLELGSGALYPVLTVALALLAFALPTLVGGSGFLSAYVAGMVLAQGALPYRRSVADVHASISWFAQVAMYLILGLLVFPSRLLPVALPGLGLALFLAVVARPLVVAACLRPFGFTWKEILFAGWVGMRGPVPIVLATYPVLSRVPGAEDLFNLVFFMVVVNTLIPGATIPWVARRLGMEAALTEPKPARRWLHWRSQPRPTHKEVE